MFVLVAPPSTHGTDAVSTTIARYSTVYAGVPNESVFITRQTVGCGAPSQQLASSPVPQRFERIDAQTTHYTHLDEKPLPVGLAHHPVGPYPLQGRVKIPTQSLRGKRHIEVRARRK